MLAAIVLAALTCTQPRPAPARTIAGTFVEIDRNDWLKVVKNPRVKEIVIANILGIDQGDCQKGRRRKRE